MNELNPGVSPTFGLSQAADAYQATAKVGSVNSAGNSSNNGQSTSGNTLPPAASDLNKSTATADSQDRSQAQITTPDQVREAVSKINEYVQQSQRTLDFQIDERSGETIVRVYDRAAEKLIRQIPSELALELAQKLNDEEPTLLFSAQV